MQRHQVIVACKVAPGKAQVVNRIKQVCFTHAVFTANACYAFGKMQLPAEVIFKLVERNGLYG